MPEPTVANLLSGILIAVVAAGIEILRRANRDLRGDLRRLFADLALLNGRVIALEVNWQQHETKDDDRFEQLREEVRRRPRRV